MHVPKFLNRAIFSGGELRRKPTLVNLHYVVSSRLNIHGTKWAIAPLGISALRAEQLQIVQFRSQADPPKSRLLTHDANVVFTSSFRFLGSQISRSRHTV